MNNKGQNLYAKAKNLIPGGTQLLTKRPEMFLPDQWPSYYAKASGAEVWDLNNNKYIDMSYNGIGTCVLGHSDPEVNLAVHKCIDAGTMSTLNCYEEVELAELFCELHPWADLVRYTRSGGEAMAVAVRIARAYSGKDKVAFCGYHGWHDWYISANLSENTALDGHLLSGLEPKGIPRSLRGSSIPFHYNNLQELKKIVSEHPNEIGVIVMEPQRSDPPENGFLEGVKKLASEIGAVLIFDEITIGFRVNPGGVHLTHSVTPDIAVFGKAIGNGFPMAAIIGEEQVMQAAQNTFISSTYWTERIGPVAALATISKFIDNNVHEHLKEVGRQVKNLWVETAESKGVGVNISGIDPLSHFDFQHNQQQALKTLFTQLMLKKGFLATNSFYATYAHTDDHIKLYKTALEETFTFLSKHIDDDIESFIDGPIAHNGFERLA